MDPAAEEVGGTLRLDVRHHVPRGAHRGEGEASVFHDAPRHLPCARAAAAQLDLQHKHGQRHLTPSLSCAPHGRGATWVRIVGGWRRGCSD